MVLPEDKNMNDIRRKSVIDLWDEDYMDDPIQLFDFKCLSDISTSSKCVKSHVPPAGRDEREKEFSVYGLNSSVVLPVRFFNISKNLYFIGQCRALSIKLADCKRIPFCKRYLSFKKKKTKQKITKSQTYSEKNSLNIGNTRPDNSILDLKNLKSSIEISSSKQYLNPYKTNAIDKEIMFKKQTTKNTINFKENTGLLGLKITTKTADMTTTKITINTEKNINKIFKHDNALDNFIRTKHNEKPLKEIKDKMQVKSLLRKNDVEKTIFTKTCIDQTNTDVSKSSKVDKNDCKDKQIKKTRLPIKLKLQAKDSCSDTEKKESVSSTLSKSSQSYKLSNKAEDTSNNKYMLNSNDSLIKKKIPSEAIPNSLSLFVGKKIKHMPVNDSRSNKINDNVNDVIKPHTHNICNLDQTISKVLPKFSNISKLENNSDANRLMSPKKTNVNPTPVSVLFEHPGLKQDSLQIKENKMDKEKIIDDCKKNQENSSNYLYKISSCPTPKLDQRETPSSHDIKIQTVAQINNGVTDNSTNSQPTGISKNQKAVSTQNSTDKILSENEIKQEKCEEHLKIKQELSEKETEAPHLNVNLVKPMPNANIPKPNNPKAAVSEPKLDFFNNNYSLMHQNNMLVPLNHIPPPPLNFSFPPPMNNNYNQGMIPYGINSVPYNPHDAYNNLPNAANYQQIPPIQNYNDLEMFHSLPFNKPMNNGIHNGPSKMTPNIPCVLPNKSSELQPNLQNSHINTMPNIPTFSPNLPQNTQRNQLSQNMSNVPINMHQPNMSNNILLSSTNIPADNISWYPQKNNSHYQEGRCDGQNNNTNYYSRQQNFAPMPHQFNVKDNMMLPRNNLISIVPLPPPPPPPPETNVKAKYQVSNNSVNKVGLISIPASKRLSINKTTTMPKNTIQLKLNDSAVIKRYVVQNPMPGTGDKNLRIRPVQISTLKTPELLVKTGSGYSPPILSIPTNEKSIEIPSLLNPGNLSKENAKQNKSNSARSIRVLSNPSSVKMIGILKKSGLDPKENNIVGTNKKYKKISLEDYKKRRTTRWSDTDNIIDLCD